MSIDYLETTIIMIAIFGGMAVAGFLLFIWLRRAKVDQQSNLENEIRRLGFEPAEWDSELCDLVDSLDISPTSNSRRGAIHHCQRVDSDYYLIHSFQASSTSAIDYQYSMLVTSPALGLSRIIAIRKFQFGGLFGRLFDEIMERIPMRGMQPVELQPSDPFKLYAHSPMQAKAFFDDWRLAQLDELSEGFVRGMGNAFICSLIETGPNRLRQKSIPAGISSLFEYAQRLLAGFTH